MQSDHAEYLLRFAFTHAWQLRRVVERLRSSYGDMHPMVTEAMRAYEAAEAWAVECYKARQGCWGVGAESVDVAGLRQQLALPENAWPPVRQKGWKGRHAPDLTGEG